MIPDSRLLDPLSRWHAAQAARTARDILPWPVLPRWNDAPCLLHAAAGAPDPYCSRCGVVLRRHQRVGAAWLYLAGKGLLADSVGAGKTAQVAAVLAFCQQTGELHAGARCVIICRSAAIGQWAGELRRMIPSLAVVTATGTARQRVAAYLSPWEVAILSERTLSPAHGEKKSRGGDIEYLENFTLGLVCYDDIDAMRTRSNRGAHAIRRLAAGVPRVIAVHGTPLQKRLMELYGFLEPVGGQETLGTAAQFRRRFVVTESVYYQQRDSFGRQVLKKRQKDVRLKNDGELKALIAPLVLRRRAADIDDATLPAISLSTVWLDPSAAQRARYEELRGGVLRKILQSGEEITRAEAVAHWMHGWQICSGLATLDGGRDDSVKLDWVMDALTGDMEDEKAVVFVHFKPNVAALSARLTAAGIGHVLLWGNEAGARQRDARLAAFRDDPSCRVLVGTTTIEQSLNLQAARYLLAVDTIPNPARMTQLAGRIRRAGSRFPAVYLYQLLLRGTQEEEILARLEAEQATADAVWDERGDLFQAASPTDILRSIAGRGR